MLAELPTISDLDADGYEENLAEEAYLTESCGMKLNLEALQNDQTPEEK